MAKGPKSARRKTKTSKVTQRKVLPARQGRTSANARASGATLFRGISSLYSLHSAHLKGGRRVVVDDLDRIENASLLVKEGRVLWVGEEKKLPREFQKKFQIHEEDLGGKVVIPAFVESHTHLIHAGNRAGEFERRLQGESYQSIAKSGGGILATVLPTRKASEAELAKIGQERADRFIAQGVTTIEAKSGYDLTVDGEMKMLKAAGRVKKARVVRTFLGAHSVPKEFTTAEAYVDHLIEYALPKLHKDGLACRIDIFVENGYFSASLARRYLKVAKEKFGFDLVVHADQLTRSGGAELAVELGARSAEHLIQINDSDVKSLAKSEVTCVLLPSADLYMNCAYPPARKLIDSGARVALATDLNPGTAPSADLALVGILARIQMKMSLAEVLAAYTVGGAFALGLQNELGSLSAGKFADFSVLSGGFEELFLDVGRMPIDRVYREGRRLI